MDIWKLFGTDSATSAGASPLPGGDPESHGGPASDVYRLSDELLPVLSTAGPSIWHSVAALRFSDLEHDPTSEHMDRIQDFTQFDGRLEALHWGFYLGGEFPIELRQGNVLHAGVAADAVVVDLAVIEDRGPQAVTRATHVTVEESGLQAGEEARPLELSSALSLPTAPVLPVKPLASYGRPDRHRARLQVTSTSPLRAVDNSYPRACLRHSKAFAPTVSVFFGTSTPWPI